MGNCFVKPIDTFYYIIQIRKVQKIDGNTIKVLFPAIVIIADQVFQKRNLLVKLPFILLNAVINGFLHIVYDITIRDERVFVLWALVPVTWIILTQKAIINITMLFAAGDHCTAWVLQVKIFAAAPRAPGFSLTLIPGAESTVETAQGK